MPLSASVSWDPRRRCYRVRVWGEGIDTRIGVPEHVFARARAPHDEPTDRGKLAAELWAPEAVRIAIERSRERKAAEAVTLGRIFDLFYEKNPNEVGPATWDRNEEMLAALLAFFGDRDPATIDDAAALNYRNHRQRQGRRNRTVMNELVFLQQLLRFGYRHRAETGMSELALFGLPMIRREAPRGIALTLDEIERVLEAELDHHTDRFRRMFLLGITTMLRYEPLRGFRLEWIDRSTGWMRVPAEAMKGRAGEKRELHVPLCQVALGQVPDEPAGYAFRNYRGNPPKWPWGSVKTLTRPGSGIRYFSAHDLRRTGITILEEAGISKSAIRRLIGHAGGDVTDGYVRVRDQRLVDAVRVFDELLGPLVHVPSRTAPGESE